MLVPLSVLGVLSFKRCRRPSAFACCCAHPSSAGLTLPGVSLAQSTPDWTPRTRRSARPSIRQASTTRLVVCSCYCAYFLLHAAQNGDSFPLRVSAVYLFCSRSLTFRCVVIWIGCSGQAAGAGAAAGARGPVAPRPCVRKWQVRIFVKRCKKAWQISLAVAQQHSPRTCKSINQPDRNHLTGA